MVVSGSLLIIQDGLRCGFAQFKLSAHRLDLRCLLFHGCSERLNFLLLLCDSRLEVFPLLRNCRSLLLHRLVLFQKLVEQHRVYCVVAHAVDFAIAAASHQIGAYLFYILGNQSEADWARRFNLWLYRKLTGLRP